MPFFRGWKQRLFGDPLADYFAKVWRERYGDRDAFMRPGMLKGWMREAVTGVTPEHYLDAMMAEPNILPMLVAWTDELTRLQVRDALNYQRLMASLIAQYRELNSRVPPSAFVADWRRAGHPDPGEWVPQRFVEILTGTGPESRGHSR